MVAYPYILILSIIASFRKRSVYGHGMTEANAIIACEQEQWPPVYGMWIVDEYITAVGGTLSPQLPPASVQGFRSDRLFLGFTAIARSANPAELGECHQGPVPTLIKAQGFPEFTGHIF